ncbi:MAG: hypothetical protein AAFN74_23985, partial [Myxococcota bacterium]
PHPHLMIKAFVEAGVPLDRTFRYDEGEITLRALIEDATRTLRRPASNKDWHKISWLLSALAQHPPQTGRLMTMMGPLDFKALSFTALQRLQRDQEFLVPMFRQRRPDLVQKRRQAIYQHSCGGLHFIQAVGHAAGLYPDLQDEVRTQLDLLRFRWEAERRLYRQLADLKPRYRPILLVQELKFYGHVLETMSMAVERGIIQADEALKAQMKAVAGDVLDTIQALKPNYHRLDSIRNSSPQTYYDLIGDGCHALRGLRESLVAFY